MSRKVICGFEDVCTDYLIACKDCANQLKPESYFTPKVNKFDKLHSSEIKDKK